VVWPNQTGWIASAGLSYFYSGRVWVDWCSKEGTDPIETSVEKAIGFLTSQFAQGKQYCILNTDGTSCSATRIPVDGRKHPVISTQTKGIVAYILHSQNTQGTGTLPRYCRKHISFAANADRDRASDLAALDI